MNSLGITGFRRAGMPNIRLMVPIAYGVLLANLFFGLLWRDIPLSIALLPVAIIIGWAQYADA